MDERNVSGTEVASKFFDDHARIAGKISVLRSLATQVLRGDDEIIGALRLKGRELQVQLGRHMKWEEEVLFPYMKEVGRHHADEVANALVHDHKRQRVRLTESLLSLSVTGRTAVDHANEMLSLLDWIAGDMRDEEACVGPYLQPPRLTIREPWASGSRARSDRVGS